MFGGNQFSTARTCTSLWIRFDEQARYYTNVAVSTDTTETIEMDGGLPRVDRILRAPQNCNANRSYRHNCRANSTTVERFSNHLIANCLLSKWIISPMVRWSLSKNNCGWIVASSDTYFLEFEDGGELLYFTKKYFISLYIINKMKEIILFIKISWRSFFQSKWERVFVIVARSPWIKEEFN